MSINAVAGGGGNGGNGSLKGSREPTGMTVESDRPFNALSSDEPGAGTWTTDFDVTGRPSIETDTGGPESPSNVLQLEHRAGEGGGGPNGNAGVIFFSQTWDIVYVYLALKISPNWQGHTSGINKVFFLKCDVPTSPNRTVYIAKGVDAGTLRSHINGQQFGCGDTFPTFPANEAGSDVLSRGDWHEPEFIFTANTPGSADGRMEMWLNDNLTHDYTDFCPTQGGEAKGFDGILFSFIWGGTGDTVDADMQMWLDHVYISGKN